jgi:hypothetical protein
MRRKRYIRPSKSAVHRALNIYEINELILFHLLQNPYVTPDNDDYRLMPWDEVVPIHVLGNPLGEDTPIFKRSLLRGEDFFLAAMSVAAAVKKGWYAAMSCSRRLRELAFLSPVPFDSKMPLEFNPIIFYGIDRQYPDPLEAFGEELFIRTRLNANLLFYLCQRMRAIHAKYRNLENRHPFKNLAVSFLKSIC